MAAIGVGGNFPPEKPTFLQKLASSLLILGIIFPAGTFFMNILNRTRIIGRQNLSRLKPPWILMSNHLTLLDDLFLGPVLFYPHILKGYDLFPYHAPEERNFYKKKLVAWFMRYVKAIPVIRGRGVYQEGMDRLIDAVRNGGLLHIYPEGTRTRNGDIGRGKEGIGRLVYETGVPVVPVYHQGLEQIMPIGASLPSFGREIRVAIGEPLRFDELLRQENNRETWSTITDRIMDAIRQQRDVATKRWGYRPVRTNGNQAAPNGTSG